MEKNSIAWVPANGYDPKQQTSLEAINWLKYISEKIKVVFSIVKNINNNILIELICESFSTLSRVLFKDIISYSFSSALSNKEFMKKLEIRLSLIKSIGV